jgi:hypothetical protein
MATPHATCSGLGCSDAAETGARAQPELCAACEVYVDLHMW